jgi:Zn-dependent oligopeptidase
LDRVEIPSHFVELYLIDYNFVSQFALVPGPKEMEPISRDIFNKLVFCDSIFQFVELEESLFFTALDVDFHSIDKEMSK